MSNRKISASRKKRTPTKPRQLSKTKNKPRKKPGPPPGHGGRPPLSSLGGEYVNTRIPREMLAAIDAWRLSQRRPRPGRPAAIRHLVGVALKLYGEPGTLPVPERIHAEDSLGDWSVDIPQETLDASTDESETTGEPKAAGKNTPDTKQEP